MFQYLIVIEPLGLLYGSSGRFLSPENLVGRSGTSFPPSAATLSGLFAAHYQGDLTHLRDLQLAGPFWAKEDPKNPENSLQNFYVPTPFNCLVKDKTVQHMMVWNADQTKWCVWKDGQFETPPNDKFEKGTWLAIEAWEKLQHPNFQGLAVHTAPWKFMPHLHPRLKQDERRVDVDSDQGSLFLENGVQLDPDTCLIYLANLPIEDTWCRFGGEGHIVNLRCIPLKPENRIQQLLNQPLDRSFVLITPGVWGSNRLSYREPGIQAEEGWQSLWDAHLLTERPVPFRYRLGGKDKTKQLSRGRYAVPSGSVYVLDQSFAEKDDRWHKWDESWFPKEGPSLKRWGCSLALPLPGALPPPSGQSKARQTVAQSTAII